MRTQLLGRVDIDESRLQAELQRAAEFPYHEPYTDFMCGRPWKSCMLWTPGGVTGDNRIAHYDQSLPSSLTEYGKRLPYLFEALGEALALEHLLFARLAVVSDSVIVPHRDYIEFDEKSDQRPQHRLHVPLATNLQSLFTEDNVVFRMRVGEIWALDVSRLHSAGVLTDDTRVHLLMDFRDPGDPGDLLRRPSGEPAGIPEASISRRPALSDRERDTLLSLSSIVDVENLMHVFGIVIKKHYSKDGGDNFVWQTMMEIGRRSENRHIDELIHNLHTYYALARTG